LPHFKKSFLASLIPSRKSIAEICVMELQATIINGDSPSHEPLLFHSIIAKREGARSIVVEFLLPIGRLFFVSFIGKSNAIVIKENCTSIDYLRKF